MYVYITHIDTWPYKKEPVFAKETVRAIFKQSYSSIRPLPPKQC